MNYNEAFKFCSVKGIVKGMKTKALDLENLLQNTYLLNDLHPKYTKNSYNSIKQHN